VVVVVVELRMLVKMEAVAVAAELIGLGQRKLAELD
jgi:hypothetical protein